MADRPAITLHLHIRTLPGKRDALLTFLRKARLYYESPGGIHMRVLEHREDASRLIEVFEYDTAETYEADEDRVQNDPQMKALLAEWRALLDGPPRVEVWRNVKV
ncbi:MAG TPA: hypothetical protein PK400_01245 [Phycisphaerales bacterium]|nr:hypothetical protein [Phycisphaerales bacterium]HRQ74887.1 hypothetical protein [Phycisphaerales bacterium]